MLAAKLMNAPRSVDECGNLIPPGLFVEMRRRNLRADFGPAVSIPNPSAVMGSGFRVSGVRFSVQGICYPRRHPSDSVRLGVHALWSAVARLPNARGFCGTVC
jgi:hypothetical protein